MCVYIYVCVIRAACVSLFSFFFLPLPSFFPSMSAENHRFLFLSPPFFRGYAVYTNYITMAEAFRLCLRGVISAVIILYVTNYTREREREKVSRGYPRLYSRSSILNRIQHTWWLEKGAGAIYISPRVRTESSMSLVLLFADRHVGDRTRGSNL